MTIKELSKLYDLNREIEHDNQKLRELRAAATNTNSKITGLPHAPGISDKTSLAVEISYIAGIIETKKLRTVCEYKRIIEYINTIDDPHIRDIITLKHINGLNWVQIAYSIGGKNTAEGIRTAYYRHFKKMTQNATDIVV